MVSEWDEWRAKVMSRSADPGTSHAAARWMVVSGQLSNDQWAALRWIREHPGCIAAEVEAGTKSGIWKRINELESMGYVRLVGQRVNPATGRMQRIIYPNTQQGGQ